MSTLDIHDPAATLLDAVERVRRGEEITLADAGRPVAKLVAIESSQRRPVFGALTGLIEMSEDFNAPLPENELREWEK